jgi:hypothetical protein
VFATAKVCVGSLLAAERTTSLLRNDEAARYAVFRSAMLLVQKFLLCDGPLYIYIASISVYV